MNHNKKKSIKPINTSSRKFGVEYENQFIVMDDAKHIIGIDGNDPRNLILENIQNGKTDKFGRKNTFKKNMNTTLVYDEKTGYLYNKDYFGQLYKYKVDTTIKSCKRVKARGFLGMGIMTSSHRFLHFVFFGGGSERIKVLDLSRNEIFQGYLETSIKWIFSLQVCVKSPNEIFLAVSGGRPNYSDKKTDLFDLTDFLSNDSIILQKYV